MENSSESLQVRYIAESWSGTKNIFFLSFLSLDRMELLSVHAFGPRLFS